MIYLFQMVIFQFAMLVYQRIYIYMPMSQNPGTLGGPRYPIIDESMDVYSKI